MTMRGTEEPRTPHRVQGGPRRRAAPRSRSGSAPRAARTARAPLRLTGRGAIVGIVLVSFGAALLAQALGTPVADGAGFLAACVLAALLVRRSDLLSLVVSPPLAYFAAALAAELVLTMGSDELGRGVAIGMGTRLAEVAPWLFAGTAAVLVVCLVRGLPSNIRELGDELSGRTKRGGGR
ncbi:hypothetical protein HDA32_000751 [Spinactinospora alkalitolerans]|uniref:DUF6542 domain-containing protein n=1 Tax=Spinactinospora alkalitolerans TaxID=687207 RepID=A0A852TQ37_9ACTN|nr:DUF6542 domain-containing protein [Spinactinospora alkalitolerans]NYE45631.1 hypothetical protein [Spinactinospora alkalitolerans]